MNDNLRSVKRNLIIQILLFVVLVVIDQVTKAVAVNSLKNNDSVSVIKDIIEFTYIENSGAAFGMLQNAMWLFYVITAVVFVVILFIWLRLNSSLRSYAGIDGEKFRPRTMKSMTMLGYLLAVLAAGAIGNLIDRIINNYVVDFIYFKFINFPVFNFADICVTVSVVLICIVFIFIYKEDPEFKIFRSKK